MRAQPRQERIERRARQQDVRTPRQERVEQLLQERQQRAQQRDDRALQRQQLREERRERAQPRDGGRDNRALNPAERREQRAVGPADEQRRAARAERVTPEAAAQGRFTGRFRDRSERFGNRAARQAALQTARAFAPQAWRRGRHARFVAWLGPVFWPYAYYDMFHYTFWPYAYDEGYWAYAYDDMFESVYWPYGSPYADPGYVGPYPDGMAAVVPDGSRPSAQSRAAARAVAQVCEPDKGLTAWPFERIARAVQPSDEQRALLDDVRKAAAQAAEAFRDACPKNVALTPTGRLEAMVGRLEATLDALRVVRPALEKFYGSLSDEQKARFNAMGPEVGAAEARARSGSTQSEQARCGDAKPGLANLPIDRIEDVVRPTGAQLDALDRLSEATEKAVERLQAACPDAVPQTPVGRLDAMQKRLEAMAEAAKSVQPALEDFYAALDSEQKARFNTLGR